MGVVMQQNAAGEKEAVPGANVYWLNTSIATTTGTNGVFMIERIPDQDSLVVSFVGMRSDTLIVTDNKNVQVLLQPDNVLDEVTVEGWKPATGIDHARGINTVVMGEKELFKAACCNLSESFETNPSVDVAFTDAITGTKQIQMLGLSGPNTMISIENMPGVRGLASSQGIQLIPGTWINSIEVTKGVGSVVNGYESIAGQINVEMKKPQDSEKLYLNGYLSQSGRSEANLNYTFIPAKKWASTLLLHASTRPFEMDSNNDSFLDFPVGSQLNAINRWVYNSGTGVLGQFGVKILKDTKQGGQNGFSVEDKFTTNRYGFEINTDRTEAWGKLGYQFKGKPYKSVGLQLSAVKHNHDSYYGFYQHDASEESGYVNLIYQSIIGSTNHKFKTGLSYLYDSYKEDLLSYSTPIALSDNDNVLQLTPSINFNRKENVPGAFIEYTYSYLDKISIIAGVRVDEHNLYGTVFTPRLHTKFDLSKTTTVRLSAGKGTRLASLISENSGVLASSRQIVFSNLTSDYAYGFRPDVAWNYGLNLSQDFMVNYRPGSFTFDYFYTDFTSQAVLDFDKSVDEANFFGLSGKSNSKSLQLQADYQLMRRFDVRVAYRWLDVKTDYLNGMLARPLIAQHRAFMNLAYATRNKWTFDFTIQWIGKQRVPDTSENPEEYRLPAYSPEYVLMNAQVSKELNKWSVYLGVENISNYTLKSPIIASKDPFGPYFDSSLVWGPIFGRMAYVGFRYRLK
jgi:outer membrane receptor for ferrienterochelin and colicins